MSETRTVTEVYAKTDRRRFIKLAGIGTLSSAAAVVSSVPAAASVSAAEEPKGSGYRETEHVKRAYEAARF